MNFKNVERILNVTPNFAEVVKLTPGRDFIMFQDKNEKSKYYWLRKNAGSLEAHTSAGIHPLEDGITDKHAAALVLAFFELPPTIVVNNTPSQEN